MEQEPKNPIQFWLAKLEEESWQLELLVSGFTIFLLLNAFGSLNNYLAKFEFHMQANGMFYVLVILLLYPSEPGRKGFDDHDSLPAVTQR